MRPVPQSLQRPVPLSLPGGSGSVVVRAVVVALILGAGSMGMPTVAKAGNWPQFRGPSGQGHADDHPVATTWSEKENVVWKTPIEGRGHASPVIWEDQIWLATGSPDGKRLGAVRLDRQSGEVQQVVTVFEPQTVFEIHGDNTYASPTPVIEAGRLYLDYGTYGVACIDTTSGEVLWRNTSLQIMHGGGPGSSPLLHNGLLIVHRDGQDFQYVAALDARTGTIRWKRERSAPYRENPITHRAFATPLLYEHGGRTLLISPGADQCHAYDPATGEELWHVRYVGFSNVPCPVAAGDLVFLCTGFFTPQMLAVKLGGKGNVTESHVVWTYKAQIPEVPSPIAIDGKVYFVSNKGVLTCLRAATGERVFVKRLGGNYNASPLLAGGQLYCCSREGLTRVVTLDAPPEVISTNKLEGAILSSPVAVDGELYIRTETHLYRIEERKP